MWGQIILEFSEAQEIDAQPDYNVLYTIAIGDERSKCVDGEKMFTNVSQAWDVSGILRSCSRYMAVTRFHNVSAGCTPCLIVSTVWAIRSRNCTSRRTKRDKKYSRATIMKGNRYRHGNFGPADSWRDFFFKRLKRGIVHEDRRRPWCILAIYYSSHITDWGTQVEHRWCRRGISEDSACRNFHTSKSEPIHVYWNQDHHARINDGRQTEAVEDIGAVALHWLNRTYTGIRYRSRRPGTLNCRESMWYDRGSG